MENKQQKTIILKNVKVSFSNFDKGSSFSEGDPVRYSGSFLIEQKGEAYELFKKALISVCSKHLSKPQMKEVMDSKVKISEEYASEQQEFEPEMARFLWASSSYKPVISARYGEKHISSVDPESETYGNKLKVFGGDRVTVELSLQYFPKYKKLAVWPKQIFILESSPMKIGESAEWREAIGKDAESVSSSDDDWDETEAPAEAKVEVKAAKRGRPKKEAKKKEVVKEVEEKEEDFSWD